MPRRRLSVRTIREVLRLRWVSGLSTYEIAESCHISPSVVRGYLSRGRDAGHCPTICKIPSWKHFCFHSSIETNSKSGRARLGKGSYWSGGEDGAMSPSAQWDVQITRRISPRCFS